MQYKVLTYRAKVNSLIELGENVMTAGVVYPAGSDDLFIVCLEPVEDRYLPETKVEEEEEKVEKKE